MRCNRHVSDLSSSIGVCASCLRDRLFVLIAAQVEENRRKTEDRRKLESQHHHHHNQAPLVFPRSVSPYICRRSDDSSWHNNDRRFYSTPQIGPTFSSFNGSTTKKHSSSKFSLLKILFRSSRSEVSDISDPRVSKSSFTNTNSSPISTTSSSSSPSWLSSLVPSRRKKQSRFVDPPLPVIHYRKDRDRGMSPANVDRDYDGEDETPSHSGAHSSETESSPPGWKKSTAQTAPPVRRRGGSTVHSKSNVSGLAFCLSPLVRASPNHRNQKDGSNIGFSGEIPRKPTKKHLSAAASLCTNRSRKLADFGRYNYNP